MSETMGTFRLATCSCSNRSGFGAVLQKADLRDFGSVDSYSEMAEFVWSEIEHVSPSRKVPISGRPAWEILFLRVLYLHE